MKQSTQILIAVCLVGILIVGTYYALPLQVYVCEILFNVSQNYEMMFTPSFFLAQMPRYSLRPYSITIIHPYTYTLFGDIQQILLQVNATATNANGILFFNGSLTVNTLADQKIQFYRDYNSTEFTKNLTLTIDAHLFVDFLNETQTDIDKTYNGQWSLTLP